MKLFELLGVITVNNQDAIKKIAETTLNVEAMHEQLMNGLETAGRWALKFASSTAKVAESTKAALTKIVSENTAAMDTIDKASQRMGMTTKSYQEWDYVMNHCSLSMGQMESGIMSLIKKMQEAENPNSDAAKLFNSLGVAATDSEGNLRDVAVVFEEIIAAMTALESEEDKLALADIIFGGAGQQMADLLNTSYEDIVALKKEANDLGIILTDEQIAAAVEFVNTTSTLKSAYGSLGADITNSLLPALQQFYDFLIEKFPTIKTEFVEGFLPALKDVVSGVLGIIQAILDPDGEMNLDESINKLVNGIVSIAGKLAEKAPELVDGIVKLITAIAPYIDDLIEAVMPIAVALIEGVLNNLPAIIDACSTVIQQSGDKLLMLLLGGSAIKYGKSKVSDWIKGLGNSGDTPPSTTPTTASPGTGAAGAGGAAVAGGGKVLVNGTTIANATAAFTPLAVLFAALAPAYIEQKKVDANRAERNEKYANIVDDYETNDAELERLRQNLAAFHAAGGVGRSDPLAVQNFLYSQYADVDENGSFVSWNQGKINATNAVLKKYGYGWNMFDPLNPDAYQFDQVDYRQMLDKMDEMFENLNVPGVKGASVFDALGKYVSGKGGGMLGGDITPLTTALANLNTKLDTVINQQAQGKTIVLNTGALVGGIGGAMDKFLGNTVLNKTRG